MTDKRPEAFIQWKNTDLCMDFFCECGADCHFDGYFARFVQCPHCKAVYEMPCDVTPRKCTEPLGDDMPAVQVMEPDEDFDHDPQSDD